MSLCVELVGQTLQVVGEMTASCQGYALLTAQEVRDVPTLTSLFATPEPEQVRQAFMSGFSLP